MVIENRMMPPLQVYNKKDKRNGNKSAYTSLIDVKDNESGTECHDVTDDDEDSNYNENTLLITTDSESSHRDSSGGLRGRLKNKTKGSSDISESESKFHTKVSETNDGIPLSSFRSMAYTDRPKPSIHCIERPIEPGDTLQSLCLKCGCTISQLKRANNLISDQEFYGLSVIKIPVREYGLLSQVLRDQKKPRSSAGDNEDKLIVPVGFKQTFNSDRDDTDIRSFMHNLDKDLQGIRGKVTSTVNESQFTTSTAIDFSVDSTGSTAAHQINKKDTLDSGLSFVHVIIIALCVCIVIPVIYVWLFEERQLEKSHNSTHSP